MTGDKTTVFIYFSRRGTFGGKKTSGFRVIVGRQALKPLFFVYFSRGELLAARKPLVFVYFLDDRR